MYDPSIMNDAECRRILRRRAQKLAETPQKKTTDEECLEVVEFLLGDEHYAIESRWIGEVYPLREFTPIPGTPPFVFGLMNLRGRILSIIDLRTFFDLPDKGLSDLNKVIVLSHDNMEFGILADAVLAAHQLPINRILPTLPTLTEIRAEYLKGVTKENLVVLEGRKLLADRTLRVHENV
nr:chemotaxis protein CheW [uncultured Desulfuromonas sp.]